MHPSTKRNRHGRTEAEEVAGVDVACENLLEEVVERRVGVRHQHDALAGAVGLWID